MDQQLAFVLFDRSVAPDMNAVAEAIRARHPGIPVQLPEKFGGKSPLIVCAGEIVPVLSMPAPVPRDEPVLAQASAIWPQAREAFQRHRAHLVVSVMGKDTDPLTSARAITAVVGGLLATVPGCVGVVWGGKVAHPVDRWLQMSRAAFAPHPDFPFMLWVAITPFRSGTAFGAVTSGLSTFVGREIEFEGGGALDLPTVIDRTAGLAAYLIGQGLVINDGDTVGASTSERLNVRHATSRRVSGLPVLLVTPAAA